MPAIKYKDSKGKRLPGVTTVEKNIGWNARVLMMWANRVGLEGKDINEEAGYEAAIGSVAHAAIEAELKGEQFDITLLDLDPAQVEAVGKCMIAWREFKDTIRVSPLKDKEGKPYSELTLISEEHRFGGTIDCIVQRDSDEKRLGILDFKTGSGIYAEALIQVCAYAELWEQYHPDMPITDLYILRLGKHDAGLTWKWVPREKAKPLWKAFEAALVLHDVHKTIKKMV